MKDLKYFAAYINPVLAAVGLWIGGLWAWGAVLFSFVLIPIVDQIGPIDTSNVDDEKSTELGHRKARYEQILGQLLLVPALYTHFFIEHNQGHHRFVATEEDSASAKKGEWLFWFWIKSLYGSYKSAWELEIKRLKKFKISFWSIQNQMIQFTVAQVIYLGLVFYASSWMVLLIVSIAGLVGILLLETINYLEHYGLRRKKLSNGRYERVRPVHSWNANYQFGRIVLYELTRHSDHHYIASKKYQVLDHHDEAPELPFGYPLMILIALVPPLWFFLMDKRIPKSSLEAANS
jgi:alkane 1-monooxygenase